jgi:integrase/recombinase XerD
MTLIPYNKNDIQQEHIQRDKSITNDEMLIALFLRNLNSRNTVRSYSKAIQQFREYIFKPLREITVSDILDYLDALDGKEKSTKHNRLSALSSLYGFGIKLGYLRYNPFAVVNKPKVSTDKVTDKFLSKEEVKLLWQELKKKERNAVIGAMLITIGLRVSELCNIKCKHFFKDFDGNVGIHIVGAKGDKNRDIKVRSDVLDFILKYRESIGKELKIPSPDNEEYLLLTRNNTRLNENYVRWIISNATEKAGLDKKISPHWYRHTSASFSLQNGCDLAKVTENFGWSSLKVAKRYLHNIDKLKETSVDYIDIDL